jgi:hypothetical protein
MVAKALRTLFYAFLWTLTPLGASQPIAVYLTWIHDPTTTMMVQWQTSSGEGAPQLSYHLAGDPVWKIAEGESQTIEETAVDVHRIHLEGLKEDSEYGFKIKGHTKEYRFRTMPQKLNRPIRIAVGGDAYYTKGTEVFQRMNRMIAFNKPDFVVIGGDLAYTKGSKHLFKSRNWEMTRWQSFLRELQKTFGKGGMLIPILPLVGNHNVSKLKHKSVSPEIFYEMFTFPETKKAYWSLDFGDYLSLVLLDTGHSWSIEGEQTKWLEKVLQERSSVPYVFAVYHIAAYPSYYSYDGELPKKIRANWVPLFEKYGVPFAFEHHNHTYKRTYPLKEGKVDPSGVTYLGDGCWGVPPRQVKTPEQLWYLEKSAAVNSCYIVTLTEEKCLIEAKNNQGKVIDQIERVGAISRAPVSSD